MTKTVLVSANALPFFFVVVFRFRRTFYKTLKEEIQEVEAKHVSAESFTYLFFFELHKNLNWL